MKWLLGIDLGTNSIGWWAFRLADDQTYPSRPPIPMQSLDGGARIFPDGREPSKQGRVGDSLAVGRRQSRGMRRNRDHARNRIGGLVRMLVDLDLLPNEAGKRKRLFTTASGKVGDPEQFNPYKLRSMALERPLSGYELGRVLFHLGRRRGFKSNRKESTEDDGGKLKERMAALREELGGRTLGQYLWDGFQRQQSAMATGVEPTGIRFRDDQDFYPDRSMYAEEFDAIRRVQTPHHGLTAAQWTSLRDDFVLFQWPLRPVERGRCELFHDQFRHWKDTPVFHSYRIYSEVNALRVIDRDLTSHDLTMVQRNAVLGTLFTQKSASFSGLRKLKDGAGNRLFPAKSRFNLESEKRTKLTGHKIAVDMLNDPRLRPLWTEIDDQGSRILDNIFETLHEAEDDTSAVAALTERFPINRDQAVALCRLKLGSGTGSLSRKAMEQLIAVMRDQGLVYSDAFGELNGEDGLPLDHSAHPDARTWERLPYYGEVAPHAMLGANKDADPESNPEKFYGKINNPTVHVALNQLRLVVNTLVDRFGSAPTRIHVELTRDLKLPRKVRDKITGDQAVRQKENDRIRSLCRENGISNPSPLDVKKIKLWEELGSDRLARQCPFSGRSISAAQIFNGEAEIEHILPFSRTLDNSMTNLTVALRWANRLKGNNTPYEAFGRNLHADRGCVWEEILQRATILPIRKRERFAPTAMEKFDQEGGFIARQLTDTAYMARFAMRYLKALEGVREIVPNPGRLTAMMRGKWGLNGILSDDNRKTREDHRHHAVDAAVIALTSRAVLREVSRLTARGADDRVHLAVPDLDPRIRDAIRQRVPTIIPSIKPDHGLGGAMYKETAYGFVARERRDPSLPEHGLVVREELMKLTKTKCNAIRDPLIRSRVQQALYEGKGAGVKLDKILAAFSNDSGVKRVRILVKDQTVKPIPSAPYKGYKPDSYVCCDIWRVPKGKPGKWQKGEFKFEGRFWSHAETIAFAGSGKQPDKEAKRPHPAAKFVTRLFKNDLISLREPTGTTILRVAGFSTTNNKLDVKPVQATDHPQTYVSINVLCVGGLRKLYVTPDGYIKRGRKKYLS